MHEDVKRSLNAIFEHEGLNQKREKASKKKPKRKWLPTFALISIITIASIIFIPYIKDENSLHRTANNPTQSDIFKYKGTYIGSGGTVSQIVNYVLEGVNYNGIQLKTDKQPFGVIIPLNENLSDALLQKTALYLFTLIRNIDFVEFKINDATVKIEMDDFVQMYNLQFETIKDEATLLAIYDEINELSDYIIKLQTVWEPGKVQIKYAISNAVVVEKKLDLSKVNYTLELDGESYLIWAQEEDIGFVKKDDTSIVYELEGEYKNLFWKYLTSDFIAISGEVTEVKDNFMIVEQSSNIKNIGDFDVLTVLVDYPERFRKGDLVKVWAGEVMEQSPPQVKATKIQYQ